jgi:hypothetical protein
MVKNQQTRNALLPPGLKSYMHQPAFQPAESMAMLYPSHAAKDTLQTTDTKATRGLEAGPRRFPNAVDEQCQGPEERRLWNV